MASGSPHLQWAGKLTASAAFCLAGVVAGGGLYFSNLAYVRANDEAGGPAHQIVAPLTVDGFTRSPYLEKQMHVSSLAQGVEKSSSGQASDVVYAVYEQGSLGSGSNEQIFMFVGGKLAGGDPEASVANFEQTYKGAMSVSPGSLGGQAACTGTRIDGESVSMCVWFDNDTFGAVVSPTMTAAKLATTMVTIRPGIELPAEPGTFW
jgi:hypothetical protein